MPHRTRGEWVELGKEAIIGVLRSEHAATIRELEARSSDHPWGHLGTGIDPHHLTEARRALEGGDFIASTTGASRGTKVPITTYHLPRRYGTATLIDKAAARKRLLTARVQGWARGTQRYPQGLIGPAGENALASALTSLANAGYTPATGRYGEVSQLLGAPVPGGPLDNAAFLTIVAARGRPEVYTVPFEVKNIREWIYGYSSELHQLLYKAAGLQTRNPGVAIVPVLVCRRRQETARMLGKAIGFYSVQYRTQLVSPAPDIPLERFVEVQKELGYEDMRRSSDAPGALVKGLRDSVRRDAAQTADRWAVCGPALMDHFTVLRRPLSHGARTDAWKELRSAIREMGIDYGATDE